MPKPAAPAATSPKAATAAPPAARTAPPASPKPAVAPAPKSAGAPAATVSKPAAAPAPKPSPATAQPAVPAAAKPAALAAAPSEAKRKPAPPDSIMSIEVTAATDGLAAVIEEAAVLFANAQDKAALKTLVTAVHDDEDTSKQARQIWLMLFDLYEHLGMKKEHDELALDFAAKFERSPPSWTDQPAVAVAPAAAPAEAASGTISFAGALDAGIAAGLEQAGHAALAGHALQIELAGLTSVDAQGCRLLLECLQQRRRAGKALSLSGEARLIALLTAKAAPGERAVDQAFWLLLLETYQMSGMHDAYEEAALNFAITYELSPPAWEPARGGGLRAAEPAAKSNTAAPAQTEHVLRLAGDIIGADDQTLKTIVDFAAESGLVIIDFSAVPRVDFVSAGQLLNTFSKLHQSGKAVKIRGANELIVALFGVMGVQAVTGIEQKR
jgi:ABC-type transporter Mla MlaB component